MTAVIFSACAHQKKTVKSKVMTESRIQQIAMDRTPCFGTCPAYRVTVNKDGKVIFKSWAYTTYEGTYEKQFPAEKVAALFKQFSQYRVDTCSPEYNSLLQDVPGVSYTITYPDSEKTITNAHFGPQFLKTLSFDTDSFSKVDDSWTKTAEAEKR